MTTPSIGGPDDGAWRDDESLAPSGPYPPGVLDTAALLSGDAATQRRALVPEFVELLNDDEYTDALLPPGSRIRLDESGWRSTIDGYGGAFGDVEYPSGESARVNIGFVRISGNWRISYIATLD